MEKRFTDEPVHAAAAEVVGKEALELALAYAAAQSKFERKMAEARLELIEARFFAMVDAARARKEKARQGLEVRK